MSRCSYVAPAGDDAVLRVLTPEDDESDNDADALRVWNGDGAVRLLRYDRERGVLLLERAPYRMNRDVTARRIAAFTAAGLDEERIRTWAVIRGAYLGADENEVQVLRALLG